jgi:hypothetical protein
MAGWHVVILVLAGVFVGMWIPVSLQLFATLRSGQKALDAVATRGGETLAQLTDTAIGLKATAAEIEALAHTANQLKDSIRIISAIGAAVGPAVVALIRALREPAAVDAAPGYGAAQVAGESSTARPARTGSE